MMINFVTDIDKPKIFISSRGIPIYYSKKKDVLLVIGSLEAFKLSVSFRGSVKELETWIKSSDRKLKKESNW